MPEILSALHYEYPPDMQERRAPYRDGHLALIAAWHADGRIVIAGALGDPPARGLLVFRDAAQAEAFTAEDPYVAAGLVVSRAIVPWTVVTPLPA
ncbi:MAG: hypothetical protein IT200_07135 [Thermoleophilia bacterium]|nr:hypothetical protein [Thermoleophilia bacterium]